MLLIGEVNLMGIVGLYAGVPFIMVWQYEEFELSVGPTTRPIKKFPVLEDVGSSREVADSDGVTDALISEVVTDVDLKSISPDLPNLDACQHGRKYGTPPGDESRRRFSAHASTARYEDAGPHRSYSLVRLRKSCIFDLATF